MSSCTMRPVQANQFVVYNDYFEDVKNETQNEKENSKKEPNRMADIGTTLRKGKLTHGLRANPQAVDAKEQPIFSRPASSRLARADARPNLNVQETLPQPSYLRGRRNNWRLKQDYSEKSASFNSPRNSDARNPLRSPTEAGLPLRDAYRRELNEQGKTLHQKKSSNPQTPLFSVIGEEDRVRIQSLCSPLLAQKMNVTHATHCLQGPGKPTTPVGRLATKQSDTTVVSKEPPPSYPFCTEAKEVSSSQHWQERHPVDYRRSKAYC